MPWYATKIFKVTGLGSAKRDRRARAFAGHPWGASILIRKHDIMFSALTVDQRQLDDLPFGCGEYRIDLTVDCTSDTQIDHPSFSYSRAQCVTRIGHVLGSWAGSVLRRLSGRYVLRLLRLLPLGGRGTRRLSWLCFFQKSKNVL